MKLFLIGPGGVGKSTCGKILAQRLKYNFIDLDIEFINRVSGIKNWIESKGYKDYCKKNSELLFQLVKDKKQTVIVLSSGFLVYDDGLGNNNYQAIKKLGLTVLLLPARSKKETIEVVVGRQLSRGLGLDKETETKKIQDRFEKYLQFGDIQIYSSEKPEKIAQEIVTKLDKI